MKFQRDALIALLIGAILGVVAQVRLERKLNLLLGGQQPVQPRRSLWE